MSSRLLLILFLWLCNQIPAAAQNTGDLPLVGVLRLDTPESVKPVVVDDIVAAGLIDSLARPGGNTTGVSILATELDAKRLDILKRVVGSGRRFAVLSDPSSAQAQPQLLVDTAKSLAIELITEEVRSPAEFAAAFASFRAKGAEALIIRSSPLLFAFRKELCSLSMTHKLPTIGQNREQAEAGCAVSYGVKLAEMHGLAAVFTDKMLRGVRPRKHRPSSQPTTSWSSILKPQRLSALRCRLI